MRLAWKHSQLPCSDAQAAPLPALVLRRRPRPAPPRPLHPPPPPSASPIPQLVYSDEFDAEGRAFGVGASDPRWTAENMFYLGTGQLAAQAVLRMRCRCAVQAARSAAARLAGADAQDGSCRGLSYADPHDPFPHGALPQRTKKTTGTRRWVQGWRDAGWEGGVGWRPCKHGQLSPALKARPPSLTSHLCITLAPLGRLTQQEAPLSSHWRRSLRGPTCRCTTEKCGTSHGSE